MIIETCQTISLYATLTRNEDWQQKTRRLFYPARTTSSWTHFLRIQSQCLVESESLTKHHSNKAIQISHSSSDILRVSRYYSSLVSLKSFNCLLLCDMDDTCSVTQTQTCFSFTIYGSSLVTQISFSRCIIG